MDTFINDVKARDRAKEKLERLRPEALSDKELLALILGKGCASDKTMERAGKILSAFPLGLKSLSFEALKRVKGLGANGAATLAAAYELAKRDNSKDYRPVLDSPSRVMEQIPVEVRGGQKEHFIALYLNTRNQLIKFETVSIGTLSASLVHPREVFGPGISHSAAALIVAHNHPSGDCAPSPEDKVATRRLKESGELLGIPLLDHLIVSDRSVFSFREHGLI